MKIFCHQSTTEDIVWARTKTVTEVSAVQWKLSPKAIPQLVLCSEITLLFYTKLYFQHTFEAKSTAIGWNKESSSLTIKGRLLSKLGTTTLSFLVWPGCRHFEFLPNVLYSCLYHTPAILIKKHTQGCVLWNSEDPLDNTSHACERIDAH